MLGKTNATASGAGDYSIVQEITGDNSIIRIKGSGGVSLQEKTTTPTSLPATITADAGIDGLTSVTVNKDSNLIASNIRKDTTIFGVTGTMTEKPIEVDTDAGMTAVLTAENEGKVYKFTGTTGTYTNGDLYIVEESASSYTITPTLTNCTADASNPSTIAVGGTATLTYYANSGYSFPSTITVTGATGNWDSTTGVLTLSNPTGNVSFSIEAIAVPSKGDLINMTLGNTAAAGTNNQYRVLSISGSTAEVVAMYDYSTSCYYNSSGTNTYSGAELDTMLNTTFYSSLSDTAKAAIVQKNITSYEYTTSSSVYSADTHASYADYSTKATHESIGNRYVYALDVEDIENYFSNTFSTANIWTLFWNTTSAPSTITSPWLRSADAESSNGAWRVIGNYGYLGGNYVNYNYAARPAFQIDLSKIDWEIDQTTIPLCFTANEAGSTVTLNKTGSPSWTGSYSTDGSTWTTYEPGTTGAITLTNAGDKVYFKGTVSAAPNLSNHLGFTMSGLIAASGNIMSLCSGDSFATVTTIPYNHCFNQLFYNCTSLISAPLLPATTLTLSCYLNAFMGCTALTSAPLLPATTLGNQCYQQMFRGCTSLTTAPALPATELVSRCYYEMFEECTSLTTVPLLAATTLANECYYEMFYNCTSLYVSDTSGSGYDKTWTIPTSGTFTSTESQGNMFTNCLGTRSSDTMAGASGASYTYYTQNTPV